MNLLNINIEIIIKKIIDKISKNCRLDIGENKIGENINDNLCDKKFIEENRYWNYVLTTLDIDINTFYYICSKCWRTKSEKHKCKYCNVDLSLFHLKDYHLDKYPYLDSYEFSWIIEISHSYNFKQSLMNRKIPKEFAAKWIKDIVDKSNCIKNDAIKNISLTPFDKNNNNVDYTKAENDQKGLEKRS